MFMCLYSFTFSQITVSVTTQQTSCSGNCNGSAVLTPTGGVAPYSYWMAGNIVSSNLSNLCVGQYTVQVSDAVSNYVYILVNITSQPGGIIATTTQTNNTSCSGPYNGIVDIMAYNGVSPYTYDWTDGSPWSPINHSTSGYLTNIGSYATTYTVTDATGCMLIQSVFMPFTSTFSISLTQTNTPCNGICNGEVNITTTGTGGPFIYNLYTNWQTPPITTPYATNLCVGMYTVMVTDSVSGCIASAGLYISNNGNSIIPNASVTTISYDESCLSVSNGSIDVSVSGSNAGPFTYIWSNGATTQDISNIGTGSYWVTVLDGSSNCTTIYDTIYSINNIPNATFSLAGTNETCLLSGDGSIDLSMSGSNPGPFTYTWTTGAITQDVFNVTSGIYGVMITDNNSNCILLSDTINSIGINCGSISGHVYIDNNGNCSFNAGDGNSLYSAINIQPGNRMAYTDNSGNFTVSNLSYGTYSVSLVSAGFIYMYPVCGTTLNININSSSPNSTNNELPAGFSSTTQPDVVVGAYSNGIVPGFASHVIYNLGNLNNVNASGKLKITLPPNYTSAITSVSPTPINISGDTVIWNFSNVNYYNTVWPTYGTNYYVEFLTPISEPLGSTFTSSIFAQPTITDLNNANNITYYQRIVTGSFDPNDKTVSPVGVGTNGEIPVSVTDLTYLIQFQNTGNGPAVNIEVKDTLSSNVDVSTFQMLTTSHNYNIDILPGNVIRWKFNNIMLPDSNSNEPASHGYIQYRIKRNSNNTPGTQIKNTAYIYFDFNSPVITNTATNMIELLSGIHSSAFSDKEMFVYPNPTNTFLNVIDKQNQFKNCTIEMENYLGQVVFTAPFTSQMDLSNLASGMYFLTLKDKSIKKTIKIIKQ